MNASARKHLDKAKGYLERGEGFYRKAAEEIVAARDADPMLTNAEIGNWFGRSKAWVAELVTWHTSGRTSPTPYSGTGRPHQDKTAARKLLREAPMEQVEKIIEGLPKERQQAIGAAAGHAYMKARQEYEEAEARVTPAERKEREANRDSMRQKTTKALAPMTGMVIADHIDSATELLRELVADDSVTSDVMDAILESDRAWKEELQVALMSIGMESEVA